MVRLKKLSHKIFHYFGFDVIRYTNNNFYSLQRESVIRNRKINLILDVGANEGDYASEAREAGYRGRIISFEPLSSSFNILRKNSGKDPLWSCENMAVGSLDGDMEINVAGRTTSSSLLPMLPLHTTICPESAYISKEKVRVTRIDSLAGKLFKPEDKILLKADVQGYEKQVLQGSERIMDSVQAIELELSFLPLYEGAPLAYEMLDKLKSYGFIPAGFSRVLADPATESLLQVDGLFVRI